MKAMVKFVLLASASLGAVTVSAQDQLSEGFRDPPADVRPRVWWHWLNGAISEEGIKLDLEWLQRSGIGGVQIFNGAMPNSEGIVPVLLPYMSPEWKSAFRHAVEMAASKNMEVTVPTSAGWSETGAPFVQPADGMKKFVWTETDVVGGAPLRRPLARPSDAPGPIGAVEFGENKLLDGETGPQPPRFYADSRVFAYRLPEGYARLPEAKVSTASGPVDGKGLSDGLPVKAIEIARPTNEKPGWVQFDYAEPVTVRSLTIVLEGKKPEIAVSTEIPARLEVSDDGVDYRKVADVVAGGFTQNTNSFAPVTGKSFRVVLQPAKPAGGPPFEMAPGALLMPGLPIPGFSKTLAISELALGAEPKVDRLEEKTGFASVPDYYAVPTPAVGPALAVKPGDVIDLTAKMRSDGTLAWTPPKGRWRIVRLGYSLTGHMNGPTTKEATGLEVDKLSAKRVEAFMNRYLDEYQETVGKDLFGAKGLQATLSDSIEAGFQNWTDDILEQFAKRRGYDPAPWLPVLTGQVVGSAAQSDAFLYDFRATLMDLLSEAHYATVSKVARERGLHTYGEALEAGNRPSLGDDLAMRRYADIPMGAMWTFSPQRGPSASHVADIKGAASAAHLYGRTYVGAESMSSIFQYWSSSPRQIKHVADTEFALGVNRLSIHSSVHQPSLDKSPGLTLWVFGQHFNRNESWAGQARPWIDYLSRTSWMLSQGRYAADIAYFYGEDAPIVTLAETGRLGGIPTKFGYDFINADALVDLVAVQDGSLATPSGMRYRALQLGGTSQKMTLRTLRRIAELAEAGVTVVGEKPLESPSLADDPAAFAALADRLWAGGRETRIGSGRILSGLSGEQGLLSIGIVPDQEVLAKGPALRFLHRTLDKGDLWFVSNATPEPFGAEVAFRVTGLEPELWDAETGTVRPLSYRTEGGRTIVKVDLEPSDAAIIVFRKPAAAASRTIAAPAERPIATLGGAWSVTFQTGRGAPAEAVAMPAGSWTDSETDGIRYFSGVATYSQSIRKPRLQKGKRVLLSLGEVGDIAEVLVNGKSVRTLWRPPYRVDITDVLRAGDNRLEIRVANRWVNRLIGDAQPGATKIAWTPAKAYSPKAPLLPSGLIGPVMLVETDNK